MKRVMIVTGLALLLGTQALQAQTPFPIPEGVTAARDLVYATVAGKPIKLDLYWSAQAEKPLPLIIWIHGGAWRSGDKRSARFARELLGDGYAVASINYRLSGEAIFPAQIIDCKAAVRWLRAHARQYNLNPTRFAAWGGSAGAHLAALLGTAEDMPEWERGDHLAYSSRIQAVVDWYGPSDFSRMDDEPGRMVHLEAGSPESQLIGGAVKDHPEKVAYANPITYVAKYNPPFQIYHGKEDKLVLPNQAVLLNEALRRAGLEPDYALLDGVGHGGSEWNDYIPQAKAFLDEHLIKNPKRARPDADSVPRQRRWVNTYFAIPELLQYVRFHSQTIGQDYGYILYLPPSYREETERRYPVIYWLPGRGGNPSGVTNYAKLYHQSILDGIAPETLIIGVNGINSSMYTNDRTHQFPIETVIMEDLIDHVDNTYRTHATRQMRALDGFSMGGYGAARLGFKYPERFGVVSIMGAAMHRPEVLRDMRQDIFAQVFGNDLLYSERHSPWTILEQNASRLQGRMIIRHFVGEQDMLVEKNKQYHQRMLDLGIEHEFGVVKGARHNYNQVYAHWEGHPFAFYARAFDPK